MSYFKKLYFITVTLLLIVGGCLIYFLFFSSSQDEQANQGAEPGQNTELAARELDGVLVAKEKANLLPIAVMIENQIDARPSAGLAQALVVYEILTESIITRFLAIYDLGEEVKKIGPVRSARPYFIDIAREYGAFYIHSGGSQAALNRLENEEEIFDLNEFFGYNSGYFWRQENRDTPHNLYTSSELLFTAKSDYQLPVAADFISWQFKDDLATSSLIVKKVRIDYSSSSDYQVVWQYNARENNYERWQDNQIFADEDGAIITADNVIVQFAPTQILDNIGRRQIDLIGRGQAIIFRDGEAISGYWQKNNVSRRTKFYDPNNQEIALNRGKIWIEIAPDGFKIDY